MTWCKNEQPINEADTHYELSSDGVNYTLHVKEAELSDQATYSVKVGDRSSTSQVVVEGKMINQLL